MRKFFAVIFALVLAFALVIGYGAKKQGIPFFEMNLEKVREIALSFRSETKEAAEQKEPVVEVIQEEENLSYDERISKGDYFYERGFYTLAANEYVKASNLEPKRLDPYFKLLQTHFALGDYEKARRNADTLLILDPANIEAKYWLSQVHLKQGRYADSQVLLDELAKINTEDPRFFYDRALLKILFSQYEEAEKLLRNADGKTPTEKLSGKIQKLLSAFQEFKFAQAAETLYLDELLARAFNENGEYELAIYKLKEVLRTRSDLRDAWILLGFGYLNLGEHYFALTSFQRAYELDSEWPATQYFMGLTYKELGDTEQAIIYFNYALNNQFEPAAVIRQKLAELYLETENYEAATGMYAKVLEENKDDVNAFVRPIWLQLDQLNQPAEALKLAELAMITFPENAMAYNLLGWAQTGTGDYAEAEKNLKKAIETDPMLAAAHLNLGKLYQTRGLTGEATENYKKAYNLDPNGSIGQLAAEKYNELMKQ